ncbi:MAG TPA: cupredoxin domain-containing protein [bacterium]|jgi:nitrite reductase (NO-forming)|nr:cupredoxin domain-containing protein [bacterium]
MAQGVRLSALLLGTALLVAACGGGGGPQGGATPPPAGASTVSVTESEFKFDPKAMTAKAGQVTFQIKNGGSVEHNFIVEGSSIKVEGIQPGQTKDVSTTLKAGSYKVLCTIPGHQEAGMTGTLTVTP